MPVMAGTAVPNSTLGVDADPVWGDQRASSGVYGGGKRGVCTDQRAAH
jgi:hypothetical protein